MIYGKTYLEEYNDRHNRLLDIKTGINNGWTKFAFWPITLNNGQKVWLQKYYEFWHVAGIGKNLWLVRCAHSNKPITYRYQTRKEGLDALY